MFKPLKRFFDDLVLGRAGNYCPLTIVLASLLAQASWPGGVACSTASGPRNLAVCSPVFVAVMIEWSLDTMHFDTSRQPSLSLETTLAQRNVVIDSEGVVVS